MNKLVKWIVLPIAVVIALIVAIIYSDPFLSIWRANRATENYFDALVAQTDGIEDPEKITEIMHKLDNNKNFEAWWPGDCGTYPDGIEKLGNIDFDKNNIVLFPKRRVFSILRKMEWDRTPEDKKYYFTCDYIEGENYIYRKGNKFFLLPNLQPGKPVSN